MYKLVYKFKNNAKNIVEESVSKSFIKVLKRGKIENIL